MKKKLYFTLVLISFLGLTFAQKPIRISYNVNVGYSSMKRNAFGRSSTVKKYDHDNVFSYDIGVNAQFKIRENIFFETGLHYVNLKGNQKSLISLVTNTSTFSVEVIDINQYKKVNTYHIGIPVKTRFRLGKISLELGAKYLRFLNGVIEVENEVVDERNQELANSIGFDEQKYSNTLRDFRTYDIGLISGMSFDFNKKISLNISSYIGLFMQKSRQNDLHERRFRQNAIGLIYYFEVP